MFAHPSAHLMTAKGSFSGGFIQPGCEADTLRQSVAKVKNAWSYTFIRPYAFMAWCALSTVTIELSWR